MGVMFDVGEVGEMGEMGESAGARGDPAESGVVMRKSRNGGNGGSGGKKRMPLTRSRKTVPPFPHSPECAIFPHNDAKTVGENHFPRFPPFPPRVAR